MYHIGHSGRFEGGWGIGTTASSSTEILVLETT